MLREPMGSYNVGICQIDTETIGEGKFKRRLPIMIFYPSDEKGEMIQYLGGVQLKDLRSGKGIQQDIRTYCYENVALSQKQKSYPVIGYSHGLTGYPMDSTLLCADLASNGYIIVSVGHPYGADIVRYNDNTYFDGWEKDFEGFKKYTVSDTIRFVYGMAPFHSYKKQLKTWDYYCDTYAVVQQKLVPLWEEDMMEGLDFIENINQGEIQSQFEHKLDLSNGIPLIGMSMGGNTVVNVSFKDKRISKAINMDGSLFTRLEIGDLKPQILVLCQKKNPYAHFRLRAAGYPNVTVKKFGDVEHWQFADGTYLSDRGEKDRDWAKRFSEEKTNLCLDFLRR